MRSFFTLLGIFFPLHPETLWKKYPIDFYDSMSHSSKFNRKKALTDPQWHYIKKFYDTGMRTEFKLDKKTIPYKFHLIWLGSSPPQRYWTIIKQLKRLHKNCIIKLWTDAEAKKYTMTNRHAFNAATNYGEKSDIFRYEILYNEGGVYIDGDFEILKSFDDLFYACTFFAGIGYDENLHIYNGLIGCNAKHPIIKLCIDTLGTQGPKNDVNYIMQRTGPHHFTRCILKGIGSSPGVSLLLPCPFFYPWPNYDRYNKKPSNIRRWIKPYSFATHLWACSWVK